MGCGTDPLFSHIDNYQSMAVVEPENHFYEHACKLAENDNRVTCYKGFFEDEVANILKKQPPLDYIVATMLTELENLNRGYEALYELCSEKTILYLCVPNAKSLHRLIAYEAGMLEKLSEISEHGKKLLQQREPYMMEEFCMEVEEHGFHVLEKGSYFPKLFTHQQMFEILERKIISKEVLDGMYKMEKYIPEYGSEIYVVCIKQ